VLAQFEDFCVVTQSVRAGIAVEVRVFDGEGHLLGVPRAGDADRRASPTSPIAAAASSTPKGL
jgi:hypothetical protein